MLNTVIAQTTGRLTVGITEENNIRNRQDILLTLCSNYTNNVIFVFQF